ncbi:unnamed protein product [Agarophyton chilense]
MEAACDFSALHCPRLNPPPPSADKIIITGWELERSPIEDNTHPCFSPALGLYTVPVDGLYQIVVEVIPLGGPAIANANNHREVVPYAICLQEPPSEQEDQILRRYHDIGNKFAKVEHIKKGTQITCVRMPNIPGDECLRFKVEIVIRKRKREEKELTKKEKKKRNKRQRKQAMARQPHILPARGRGDASRLSEQDLSHFDIDDASDSDSEWETGFESDSTSDDLPASLAKRFKPSHHRDFDDLNRSDVFFDINDEVVS